MVAPSSASPRLLVVGGTGFIGRHLVARALDAGWSVTTMSIASAAPVDHRAPALTADITDRSAVEAALHARPFDYVVNCGGYINHSPLSAQGRAVLEAHFLGVVNLVQALDRESLRLFVNVGSSDEYGNAPAPQCETARESPISPYSAGKAAATHLLQTLFRSEGFPGVTLRLFLTYGPGQQLNRFLPQVITGCLNDASFPVSEGRQLRDFCYVDDTIDAVFAALGTPAAAGEVVNVASGRPMAIRDAILTVRNAIGKGTPRFGEVPYRPGENMALYADASKAAALLGWRAKTSFADGVARTIDAIRMA